MELQEKVIKISRVVKVVKGGRKFSFNALSVVGDMESNISIGFGKANEVSDAIKKSIESAKKRLIPIELYGNTISHEVFGEYKSAKVLLKPCSKGTGIIAGPTVRAIIEKVAIQDVLSKTYGSSNHINIAKATLNALQKLQTPLTASKRRGISLSQLFGITKD